MSPWDEVFLSRRKSPYLPAQPVTPVHAVAMEGAYEGRHTEAIPIRRSHHDFFGCDMQQVSTVAQGESCEGGKAINSNRDGRMTAVLAVDHCRLQKKIKTFGIDYLTTVWPEGLRL